MQKKILAVDDDELVLKSIKALLTRYGWIVEALTNPLDALRKLRDEKYDCLLLDIRMPQLSGTELLKRIRGLENEGIISAQQIIFLTGYADQDARQKAFEFGAFNYVYKPFDASDLINRIERCVEAKNISFKSKLAQPLDKSFDFILTEDLSKKRIQVDSQKISFESIDAKVNVVTPEELFWWYAKTGFFYPSKKRKLTPYLPLVEDCWKKALKLGEEVFWIATVSDSKTNSWASICNWRTTNAGWVSQHLIGTGHAAYPLMLMLGTQLKVIAECGSRPYQSFQNWYRPTNKYANKVFGLLGASIKKESRCVNEFSYYLIPKSLKIDESVVKVVECTNQDPREIKEYLKDHKGGVYCQAEEYNQQDIQLKQVNEIYKKVGLNRTRSFFLAYDKEAKPVGALIVRKGPFGINFSLIENSCELILEESNSAAEKTNICKALFSKMIDAYKNTEMPFVVLLTEAKNNSILELFGQKSVRTYDQFIWLKSGYQEWYDVLFDISRAPISRLRRRV